MNERSFVAYDVKEYIYNRNVKSFVKEQFESEAKLEKTTKKQLGNMVHSTTHRNRVTVSVL